MSAGGIIVLVVIGVVWVAFVLVLFKRNESNHESTDDQTEPKNPDSSI